MKHSPRHPEVRARLREPRRATARMSRRREQAATAGAVHPPISGLPEIGILMRKSAIADLRWPAKTRAPQDDGLDVRTVVLDHRPLGAVLTRRLGMKLIVRGLLSALALIAASPERATAQPSDYPNRAGHLRRAVRAGRRHQPCSRGWSGQKLEQRLGKPFVVENRPGGGGVTAATAVARAAPDGYTIMMASSTVLAINVTRAQEPALRSAQGADADRAARARAVRAGGQSGSLPVQSVADLVKLAKEKPGQLSLRHAGPRHVPSSQRRDVQEHVRARPGARALQGLGAGAQRSGRAATSR